MRKQAYRTLSLTALLSFAVLALLPAWGDPAYRGIEKLGPVGDVIPISELGRKAIGLTIETIRKEPLPLEIATTGKIEAKPTREFDQHAMLSGRIEQIFASPGDRVKAGDKLALVDSPEINQLAAETLQTKTQLESQIEQQEAQLSADIKQAQAELSLAEANKARDEKLYEEGIGSQKAMLASRAQLVLAQSTLDALVEKRKITIRALQTQLKLAFDSLSHRLAQLGVPHGEINEMVKLQHTILIVPVTAARSGIITQISCSAGQSISPTDMLFRISDLTQVWATADIYEDDMARIKTGQKVLVKVAALPHQEFDGELSFVGSQVDPVTRTLPVRAELENPVGKLKPDMFAELYIETNEPTPAILLPREAIVERAGHHEVFVETKAGLQPTAVDIARTFGDKVEVVNGVYQGQRVVVRGAFQLEAERLKAHGQSQLFVQPTEGERETPGMKDSTSEENKGGGMPANPLLIGILLLGAFLCGTATALLRRAPQKIAGKEMPAGKPVSKN